MEAAGAALDGGRRGGLRRRPSGPLGYDPSVPSSNCMRQPQKSRRPPPGAAGTASAWGSRDGLCQGPPGRPLRRGRRDGLCEGAAATASAKEPPGRPVPAAAAAASASGRPFGLCQRPSRRPLPGFTGAASARGRQDGLCQGSPGRPLLKATAMEVLKSPRGAYCPSRTLALAKGRVLSVTHNCPSPQLPLAQLPLATIAPRQGARTVRTVRGTASAAHNCPSPRGAYCPSRNLGAKIAASKHAAPGPHLETASAADGGHMRPTRTPIHIF